MQRPRRLPSEACVHRLTVKKKCHCHVYPRLIICQILKQSMHIPYLYFKAAHHNSTNLFFSHLIAMNSSCNIHSEFQCGNGECIDYQLTCDGITHCKDRSDEKMQYCGKNPFRCGAVCVPSGFISKLNEGSYRRSSCSPVTRANKMSLEKPGKNVMSASNLTDLLLLCFSLSLYLYFFKQSF